MLKKLTIFIAFSFLLLGCNEFNEQNSDVADGNTGVVCNDPYIRNGIGCCLDTNSDRICDKDQNNDTGCKTIQVPYNETISTGEIECESMHRNASYTIKPISCEFTWSIDEESCFDVCRSSKGCDDHHLVSS